MALKKMGKRQENLMAKIAAQLGTSLETVKEVAAPLYSEEATILEVQSAINFFKARVKPEQGFKELKTQFEARYEAWRFKSCGHCKREFAYSYTYDGVGFCSLECADENLFEITGLRLTRGRDIRLRWGIHHPAIVSADALESLRAAYPDSAGTYDVPLASAHPKYLPAEQLYSDS